jgi:dsRNA-specific ribonuclease
MSTFINNDDICSTPAINLSKFPDVTISPEGDWLFSPYNSKNIEITREDVIGILEKYGLPPTIHNFELYKRAFVHSSYVKRSDSAASLTTNKIIIMPPPTPDSIPVKSKSNERLEFLGDGVLELVTKYYLYRRFPKENEGFMTEKKIAIVKNEAIGKIAYDMGIYKWVLLSTQTEDKNIRVMLKKLGCLFEAFIGAIFLDFNKVTVRDEENWFETLFKTGPGFQMAQKFIEAVFEEHIDWVKLIQTDDNYKNILQKKIQREFKITPVYLEIEHTIEFGYTMGVYLCIGQSVHTQTHSNSINMVSSGITSFEDMRTRIDKTGKLFLFMGSSTHKLKRNAEQKACQNALETIID